jgi:S1 RNA binding domain protein
MPVEIGQILVGRITGITKFGAFVELPGGDTGLVHISEVADSFVKDVNDYVKQDETVRIKVIGISQDGKISLSIRKAKDDYKEKRTTTQKDTMSFEDKLSKFLKDSEERLLDIKRNHEAKRGSNAYGKRRAL